MDAGAIVAAILIFIIFCVPILIWAFRSIADRISENNEQTKKYNEAIKNYEKRICELERKLSSAHNEVIKNSNISDEAAKKIIEDLKIKILLQEEQITQMEIAFNPSLIDSLNTQIKDLKIERDRLLSKISTLTIEVSKLESLLSSSIQEKDRLRIENRNTPKIADQAAEKAEATKWDKRRTEITRAIARASITPSDLDLLYDGIYEGRLINSLEDNLLIKKMNITAEIPSATQEGVLYHTTLTTCDCIDRSRNPYPCKHSLLLAYSLGILQIYPDYIEDKYKHTLDDLNSKTKEKLTIEDKIKKAKNRNQKLLQSNTRLEKLQSKINQVIEIIIADKCNGYPYLAGIIIAVFVISLS